MAIATCSSRVIATPSDCQRSGNDGCVSSTKGTWNDCETSCAWCRRGKKYDCCFSSFFLSILWVQLPKNQQQRVFPIISKLSNFMHTNYNGIIEHLRRRGLWAPLQWNPIHQKNWTLEIQNSVFRFGSRAWWSLKSHKRVTQAEPKLSRWLAWREKAGRR